MNMTWGEESEEGSRRKKKQACKIKINMGPLLHARIEKGPSFILLDSLDGRLMLPFNSNL